MSRSRRRCWVCCCTVWRWASKQTGPAADIFQYRHTTAAAFPRRVAMVALVPHHHERSIAVQTKKQANSLRPPLLPVDRHDRGGGALLTRSQTCAQAAAPLSPGDAAILRLPGAAGIIDADLWTPYAEPGGASTPTASIRFTPSRLPRLSRRERRGAGSVEQAALPHDSGQHGAGLIRQDAADQPYPASRSAPVSDGVTAPARRTGLGCPSSSSRAAPACWRSV